MRAVAFSRFGGPEVLEVAELAEPEPGPGQVRIRVSAAAVNPTDTVMRSGARAEALAELPPPWIPGMELAGVVDAAGTGSRWNPGDHVMAIVWPIRPGGGAQAELVVVPDDAVAAVPQDATLHEAATLPMNGLTVRLALDLLALRPGQTLAVTGAAGAVGGYAVELGVAEGLRVIADAAPADRDLVAGFGADAVVDRGDDVAAAIRAVEPDGADALIDAAVMGSAVLAAVREGGALAAVRSFDGESERGITIHGVRVRDYVQNHEALDGLGQLAGRGALSLRVAGTFDPSQAAEAHRRLEAGGVRGRMLITF
jgi:NADPH:quinone reductase-like Zn-dependent oxidoreductase